MLQHGGQSSTRHQYRAVEAIGREILNFIFIYNLDLQ